MNPQNRLSELKTKLIKVGLVAGVLFIVWFLFSVVNGVRIARKYDVETTTPANASRYINQESNIFINYDNPISDSDKDKMEFEASPSVAFDVEWDSDTRVVLKPKTLMDARTEYTIKVKYGGSTLDEFTFETVPYSVQEVREQVEQQIKEDWSFNEDVIRIEDDYPWYGDLPIDEVTFKIVYDYELQSFRIRLKMKETAPADQQEAAKSSALEALRNIGVDPDKEGYHFLYSE